MSNIDVAVKALRVKMQQAHHFIENEGQPIIANKMKNSTKDELSIFVMNYTSTSNMPAMFNFLAKFWLSPECDMLQKKIEMYEEAKESVIKQTDIAYQREFAGARSSSSLVEKARAIVDEKIGNTKKAEKVALIQLYEFSL